MGECENSVTSIVVWLLPICQFNNPMRQKLKYDLRGHGNDCLGANDHLLCYPIVRPILGEVVRTIIGSGE